MLQFFKKEKLYQEILTKEFEDSHRAHLSDRKFQISYFIKKKVTKWPFVKTSKANVQLLQNCNILRY